MTDGFEMKFYPPDHTPRPHFDRFEDGVAKAYEMLKDARRSEFAVSVSSTHMGADLPMFHLERKPDAGVLAQLYVPESMSPAGEDGWYNLVEPANLDRVSIKDVSTVWDQGDPKEMVETRLSEGVLFSRRMYVPPDLAKDALKSYLDTPDLKHTLKQNPWKFIGLI